MNILSIQSHVSYGHVGNAAAVFLLQLLGHEVWAVHTAQLSNHTGHATARGQRFRASDIQEVILGIEGLGVLPNCDAVLSGYLGDAETADLVSDIVLKVKAANPTAVYLCDPVMGDDAKGLYVSTAVAEAIETVLGGKSDILTPNRFELSRLTGKPIKTIIHAVRALREITKMGTRIALCTSLPLNGSNAIAVVGCNQSDAWAVEVPRLHVEANGAGDCLAAIFLARVLNGHNLPQSISFAVSSVHDILKLASTTANDLPLVAARDHIVQPTKLFPAVRLDPETYK